MAIDPEQPTVGGLTVAIIACDEADRIGEAIASAAFADEVLVVDGGSRDHTVAVARALGARVVSADWPGHVAQKQRATDLATHDWVFALDADERIPEALGRQARAAVDNPGGAAGFTVPRRTWWLGAPIEHGAWWPDRRVRLFDRRRGWWGGEDPHDHVVLGGPSGALSVPLEHHAYRDLGDHLSTIARYARIQADGLQRRGVQARWWDWSLRPVMHFLKALVLKGGWRDGVRGMCIAWLGAAHVALKWGLVALGSSASGAETGEGW